MFPVPLLYAPSRQRGRGLVARLPVGAGEGLRHEAARGRHFELAEPGQLQERLRQRVPLRMGRRLRSTRDAKAAHPKSKTIT